MGKIKTSISIEKDLYDKLKGISNNENRSFSQQISNVIKEYLKDREK